MRPLTHRQPKHSFKVHIYSRLPVCDQMPGNPSPQLLTAASLFGQKIIAMVDGALFYSPLHPVPVKTRHPRTMHIAV